MRWSTCRMRGPQLLENLNSGWSDHLDMSDKIMTKYPIFLVVISAIGNREVSMLLWVCTRFTLSAVALCINLHFSSMSCDVWPLFVQSFFFWRRPPHFWAVQVTLVGRYSDSLQAGQSGYRIPVGARFSAPVQTGPEALYDGYRVFPGGKAAGAWRWPHTPSSTKVKEREYLYFYFPSGPSWSVLGGTLPLPGHTQTHHNR
jgi:hypothetical protein